MTETILSGGLSAAQSPNDQGPESTDRRNFVTGAIAAGLAIAPGMVLIAPGQAAAAELTARPAGQKASASHRWGILIDTTKCASGCTACVTACVTENKVQGMGRPATDPQWIRKVDLRNTATGEETSLPVMCQHCEKPPCVDVCPTGASMKRDDGIVLVDRHICIGCRYCMMACPYKARSFIHEDLPEEQKSTMPRGKGCVESCTLCVHKIDKGEQPACVQACASSAGGAMLFGDLKDPQSEISRRVRTEASTQIRADYNLNTGIRYQGI